MQVFAALLLFFQAIWSSIIGIFSPKWSVDNQPADIEAAIHVPVQEVKMIVPVAFPVNNLATVIDNIVAQVNDTAKLSGDDSKDGGDTVRNDTTRHYQPTRRQSLLLENIRKYAEDDTYDSDKDYETVESVVISPEPEFVVVVSGEQDGCRSPKIERETECPSTSNEYLSPMSVSSKPSSLRTLNSNSNRNGDRRVQFDEHPSQVQFTPLPERVSRKRREQRDSQRIEMYDYLAKVSDAQAQVPIPTLKRFLSHSESLESISSEVSTASCYSQDSMVDDSDSNETGDTSMPSTPDTIHRHHIFSKGNDSETSCMSPAAKGSASAEDPVQGIDPGTRACESETEESLLQARTHAREETLRKLLSSGSPPSYAELSSRCITPEPPLLLPACLFPQREFEQAQMKLSTSPVMVRSKSPVPPDTVIQPLKIVKKVKILHEALKAPEVEIGKSEPVESGAEEAKNLLETVVVEALQETTRTEDTVQEFATVVAAEGCSETSVVNQTAKIPERKRTPRPVVVPEGYF